MAAKSMDRKIKAATLVPLALLSAAWSASLANVSAATASDPDSTPRHSLPDNAKVPAAPIEAPASVPVPGAIAAAVPAGSEDSVVASASTSGIPAPALSAYQRGAQIMNAAYTTCNIPWELIAAIARVESNHGQYGGNTLGDDGVSRPGVYGPTLDGRNGTQTIADTDAGELDGDPVYDRAVGPMQFLPTTWAAVKVDADGDGQRNPQDIDDAALATAVYLCSGKDDLSSRAGQEKSVFRYNHNKSYVSLVLRIMEAYSQGDYTAMPSGVYGGTVFTPDYTAAIKNKKHTQKAAKARAQATATKNITAANTPLVPVGSTTSANPNLKSSGASTGDNGGKSAGKDNSSPAKDSKPKVNNPVAEAGKKVVEAAKPVTDVIDQVTKPVADAIEPVVEAASVITTPLFGVFDSMSALLGFCFSKFPFISLLAPKAAKLKCEQKVGLR